MTEGLFTQATLLKNVFELKMPASSLKNKTFAANFAISHLKKVGKVVHFGGQYKDEAFIYIPYDGFTGPAKGELKKKLEELGIIYDRYVKYGAGNEVAIETLLHSRAGELIRVVLPDPDAVGVLDVANDVQGQIQFILQVDYAIESAFGPIMTTKLMKSVPARNLIDEGPSVPDIIRRIGAVEYAPPYNGHFFKSVAKVTCFRTGSAFRIDLNFIIPCVQVYAVPDNPWHKGSGMVLISKTQGNRTIGGAIPCILSRGSNWKQRNQKNYIIRFTQPDPKIRYWVGRVKIFIRLKLSAKAEMSAIQLTVDNIINEEKNDGAASNDSGDGCNVQSANDVLIFNGALPALPVVPSLPAHVPSAFSQAPANNDHIVRGAVHLAPVANQVAMQNNGNVPFANVGIPVGAPAGGSLGVPAEIPAVQDPFGIDRWTGKYIKPFSPKVIGDFKVFASITLRECRAAGSRLGSRALSKKLGISDSTCNKDLRFLMCLVNKNIRFAEIPDLKQSLGEFCRTVLGYPDYASVTSSSGNKYANMTIAQIAQLLS